MSKPMSTTAAARIHAAEAKASGGGVSSASFAARAQAAAATNNSPFNGPSKTGEDSGKGRGNNGAKAK